MNELINKFLPFEEDVFLALNGSDSLFWDNAMWTFTGLVTWLPMALIFLYIIFRNQQFKEGLLVLGVIALVILLSSIASSCVFKPLFKRFRPTHHPDYKDLVTIVNDFRGGDYGFISGHSTNSFGLAFIIAFIFRNQFVTFCMMLWAGLNSYSRIYLGVHFISDILAGFVIGTLIAFLVYNIYIKLRFRYFETTNWDKRNSIYTLKQGNVLGVVIISYTAFVILFSPLLSSLSYLILPDGWF